MKREVTSPEEREMNLRLLKYEYDASCRQVRWSLVPLSLLLLGMSAAWFLLVFSEFH